MVNFIAGAGFVIGIMGTAFCIHYRINLRNKFESKLLQPSFERHLDVYDEAEYQHKDFESKKWYWLFCAMTSLSFVLLVLVNIIIPRITT
ncbi:hypothetical protein [Paenibacillus tyrfis]|uniref:hypothetical protein n=1 Tax=Paenibacillus tyrfis TaxID=1501230 RepID=UPI0020A1003B|nr:hypothetical protein [Paenibacillus tyrfis]MCP1312111.1 hypothetical protein [Paenibacillus tyrfis]